MEKSILIIMQEVGTIQLNAFTFKSRRFVFMSAKKKKLKMEES